jgi:hypothetical protein
MRLKFKHLVIAGLVLAGLQTGLQLPKSKKPAAGDSNPATAPLKVQAREVNSASTAIAPVPVTNWSVQVSAVMTSEASTTNKAIGLLGLFPNLPEQGQVEAAQHSSRLLPDNYYNALGTQMTNAAVAPAARRAIFADLLTRPNQVKLPWLVAVASTALDGQSDEAAHLLKSILNEDHGSDWPLWRERVAVWMTLHPDR